MNITNDNMMCNILTVLKRPKMGARGGKKGGKSAKIEEKIHKSININKLYNEDKQNSY